MSLDIENLKARLGLVAGDGPYSVSYDEMGAPDDPHMYAFLQPADMGQTSIIDEDPHGEDVPSPLLEICAEALNILPALIEEVERLREVVTDAEEMYAQQMRSARIIDVALNGEDGAAAPLLIDVMSQIKSQRWKLVRADGDQS